MTHCVCNYPNTTEFIEIFQTLSEYSQYIEVQFPFSDPIADGPIIEKANEEVLKHGFTTNDAFTLLYKICQDKKWSTKILIMTYYNIVLNYWVEKFCHEANRAWVYWFIVPDIVFWEEGFEEFAQIAQEYKIYIIPTISPNTTSDRLTSIAKYSTGFVYAISKNMTTGNSISFWTDFEKYISNVKQYFPDQEIWIWFWIKTKQDVESVSKLADFSIIWSELIKRYQSGGMSDLRDFLKDITQ